MYAGISSTEQQLGKLCQQAANYFPLWLVLGCGLALWKPAALDIVSRDHISAGLAVTMLAMGMTLSTEVVISTFTSTCHHDRLLTPGPGWAAGHTQYAAAQQ